MSKREDRRVGLSVVLSTGGFGVQGMNHAGNSAWWEIEPRDLGDYGEAVIAMAMLAKEKPDVYVIEENY